jgi:amino acid transporter
MSSKYCASCGAELVQNGDFMLTWCCLGTIWAAATTQDKKFSTKCFLCGDRICDECARESAYLCAKHPQFNTQELQTIDNQQKKYRKINTTLFIFLLAIVTVGFFGWLLIRTGAITMEYPVQIVSLIVLVVFFVGIIATMVILPISFNAWKKSFYLEKHPSK